MQLLERSRPLQNQVSLIRMILGNTLIHITRSSNWIPYDAQILII
jgi:hypothetical protein